MGFARRWLGVIGAFALMALMVAPLGLFTKAHFGRAFFNYPQVWMWMDDFEKEAWPWQTEVPERSRDGAARGKGHSLRLMVFRTPHGGRCREAPLGRRHGGEDPLLLSREKLSSRAFFWKKEVKNWQQPLAHSRHVSGHPFRIVPHPRDLWLEKGGSLLITPGKSRLCRAGVRHLHHLPHTSTAGTTRSEKETASWAVFGFPPCAFVLCGVLVKLCHEVRNHRVPALFRCALGCSPLAPPSVREPSLAADARRLSHDQELVRKRA